MSDLSQNEVQTETDENFDINEDYALRIVGEYVPPKFQILENTQEIVEAMLRSIPLRPEQNVLDFSENYRTMPSSNARGAGMLFKADPYQRKVLEIITNPKYDRIILMFAAQTGKSEILNNTLAYFMYMDPSEILMVLPTEEAAEEYVKRRIDPMIRDNWFLKDLISSKDSRNNIMNKYFIGGSLSFVGSASPTKLASKPIRILICDEVDRFAGTKEGSTLKLALQRTNTFIKTRKILLASTPTEKNKSVIEQEYKTSIQHQFHVPCRFCGEFQVLDFEQVIYKQNDPQSAMYECTYCRNKWTNLDRRRSVRQGKWVVTGRGSNSKAVGFHLNALYSLNLSMADLVEDYLAIKTESDKQVFLNTSLCQTYEPVSINFDPDVVEKEYETYTPETLPKAVRFVTCGIDVQKNRIELEFRGWGQYYESWGIKYMVLFGDTSHSKVWNELAEVILSNLTFTKLTGKKKTDQVYLVAVTADCGYRTNEVYDFCLSFDPYQGAPLVIPVKGAARNSSMVEFYTIHNIPNAVKSRISLTVNTFKFKQDIYTRLLSVADQGRRLVHFPAPQYGYDPEYYKQLVAERMQQTVTKTGEIKYEFVKERERNEALDIFVYNFAAAHYFENIIIKNIKNRD